MSKCQTCGSEHIPTPANAGGCWFCECAEGPMSFDFEFDTWYHEECLQKAIDKDNEEAIIMERARC